MDGMGGGIMPGSDPGAGMSMGGGMSPDDSGRSAQMASSLFPRMGPSATPRVRAPRGPRMRKNPGAAMRSSVKRIGKPRVRTGMSFRARAPRIGGGR